MRNIFGNFNLRFTGFGLRNIFGNFNLRFTIARFPFLLRAAHDPFLLGVWIEHERWHQLLLYFVVVSFKIQFDSVFSVGIETPSHAGLDTCGKLHVPYVKKFVFDLVRSGRPWWLKPNR